MFFAVLLVLAFSLWYTPWRLGGWLGAKKRWPWILAAFAWTAGYLALVMSGAYTLDNRLCAVLFVALGLLFIFGVYAFFETLIIELIRLRARRLPLRAAAAGALALAAVLTGAGYVKARLFTVTYAELEVPGLAAPVDIVHVPDLHLGPARGAGYLKKVLAAVEEIDPDFVVYNGDMVDGNIALRPEVFDQFRAVKAPQYFTTGNHEYYVDTGLALSFVRGAGIRVLMSERAEQSGLNLIGLQYMNADLDTDQGHRVNDLGLDQELPKIPRDPGLPDLLVHHSPVGLQYVDREGVEVMLAGHTHGGQAFPGTLLIRRNFPYFRGRYDVGGVKLLVSQGAGTFGPAVRLGTFNELQHVRLVPAAGGTATPAAGEGAAFSGSGIGSAAPEEGEAAASPGRAGGVAAGYSVREGGSASGGETGGSASGGEAGGSVSGGETGGSAASGSAGAAVALGTGWGGAPQRDSLAR